MDHTSPSAPVVVGIDGSKVALRAALWAVEGVANNTRRYASCTSRLLAATTSTKRSPRQETSCIRLGPKWKPPENRSRSNPTSFMEIQAKRW